MARPCHSGIENLTLEPMGVPLVATLVLVLAKLDIEAKDSREPASLLIDELIEAPVGLWIAHIAFVFRLDGERLTL